MNIHIFLGQSITNTILIHSHILGYLTTTLNINKIQIVRNKINYLRLLQITNRTGQAFRYKHTKVFN